MVQIFFLIFRPINRIILVDNAYYHWKRLIVTCFMQNAIMKGILLVRFGIFSLPTVTLRSFLGRFALVSVKLKPSLSTKGHRVDLAAVLPLNVVNQLSGYHSLNYSCLFFCKYCGIL